MKYTGACHCKKVSYEVNYELGEVISCNCSHCQIKGLLLAFTPSETFTLLKGENDLTSYKFNKKVIDHLFCKHCGVESFARGKDPEGKEVIALNVRSFDNVDIESLTIVKVDGKNW